MNWKKLYEASFKSIILSAVLLIYHIGKNIGRKTLPQEIYSLSKAGIRKINWNDHKNVRRKKELM